MHKIYSLTNKWYKVAIYIRKTNCEMSSKWKREDLLKNFLEVITNLKTVIQ